MTSSISEKLADAIAQRGEPPRDIVEKLLIDVAGLCVAARNTDYVRAALDGWEAAAAAPRSATRARSTPPAPPSSTAPRRTARTSTTPSRAARSTPAQSSCRRCLALAERQRLSGKDALKGIAVGLELTCRASLVAPKMIHKAGFHPTAVLGAMGAAAAAAVALNLSKTELVNALGIAGSMAAGIIEYLAEGTWTKRMHPGWAAQSGIRAADLARSGFIGPRTVFEGEHGLYHGFARTTNGQWDKLLDGFGKRWVTSTIAFKLYPCGTMTHPYIDCARRLGKKVDFRNIEEIVCEVAEGTVHRLWEPLAAKQRVPNAYAGKFSTPYCIASGFVLGNAGLDAFTEERVRDPRLVALAGKVRYQVDPDNPYPNEYTGHVRVRMKDGSVVEERQAHLRGGAHEPLSRADVEDKFRHNCTYGGWSAAQADRFLAWAKGAFDAAAISLSAFRG